MEVKENVQINYIRNKGGEITMDPLVIQNKMRLL